MPPDASSDIALIPPPGDSTVELLEAPNESAWAIPPLERPDVRFAKLPDERPHTRALPKPALRVTTIGWRFPKVENENDRAVENPVTSSRRLMPPAQNDSTDAEQSKIENQKSKIRIRPPNDVVTLKERLLYLLQPPLEEMFRGRQVRLPFEPYPYQMEGIAFLMPRWSALLADEMGLGKTMQAILSLRLLLHGGIIQRALIVCPKPLVPNWTRELRMWAEDVPFEVIGGDTHARRCGWLISNSPIKLVNYELLTRDEEYLSHESSANMPQQVSFDLVILDEAQRIKSRNAKTSKVVRSIWRERSWALTGTPVENRPEDLINLFAFIKPEHVPIDTPVKRLPELTGDYILRRCKEDVLSDLPPKVIRDAYVELTPAQQQAYELAEQEGVVHLNALGDTITVQHVFELIMRLKQICNFDPLTGESAKVEQLQADLAEVADSGRKAILFSQWVEPLQWLAVQLQAFGPLEYHGRVPSKDREQVLEAFKTDSSKHLLLMSYGTGSVGLNLQFSNYVFLFDRWWNPAVEDQAINRAHRIGQKESVFVTRFVTPDTIEGRIVEVLEKKRQLFADLIEQNGPPPSMGLNEEEIFGLFDLQVRPRRSVA